LVPSLRVLAAATATSVLAGLDLVAARSAASGLFATGAVFAVLDDDADACGWRSLGLVLGAPVSEADASIADNPDLGASGAAPLGFG
jgi:hypothetical protein